MTHQGMAVRNGVRGVFVASFSTRTEVSPQDRVRGLSRSDGSDGWSGVSSGFRGEY